MSEPEAGKPGRRALRLDLDVAALLLLTLLPCARSFLPDETLYGRDLHLVFWGQIEAAVREVAAGVLPAWNPWAGFGQPLLANPEAQLLYPPTWLNLVLRPPTYLALFTYFHLAAAALGVRALALRLGQSRSASLLAGAAFALAGPLPSLASMWHHFASASLLPWTFEAAVATGATGRFRDAGRWGALLALQLLAGSGDYGSLGAAASGLLALAAGAHAAGTPGLGRALRRGLLAGGLAALLSAPQILPTLALVRGSGRVTQPDAARTHWSVHPVGLLEVVTPHLMSSLGRGPLQDQLSYQREPFLASLYLGALLAPLVLGALAAPRWSTTALAILGTSACLIALGRHAPFFAAVGLVPPFHLLRYPVKLMPLASLAWALLAGQGLDAWRAPELAGRAWRSRVALPLLGIGTGLLAVSFWWPHVGGLPAGSRELATSAAVLVGGALLAAIRGGTTLGAAPAGLALLAVADLGLRLGSFPTAPRALFDYRPEVLQSLGPEARVYSYDYSLPDKAWLHLGRAAPSLAGVSRGWDPGPAFALGLQSTLAPLTSPRWSLRGSFEIDHRGLYPPSLNRLVLLLRFAEGTPAHHRLLQMAGVTHVIALHEDGLEDLPEIQRVPGVLHRPVRLLGVPGALPRVRVVAGARSVDEQTSVDLLRQGQMSLEQEILLPAGRPAALAGPPPGSCTVVADLPDRLVVDALMESPGWLTVADAWDPAWHARVDGRTVPVERANLAFRAVAVPPGRHRVELHYVAPGLGAGLALGVLGLGALAVALRSPS